MGHVMVGSRLNVREENNKHEQTIIHRQNYDHNPFKFVGKGRMKMRLKIKD